MTRQKLLLLAPLCLSALLAVAPCVEAQDNSTAVPATATSATSEENGSSPASPAAKKVWTNEDVTDLRDNSTISILGKPDTEPTTPANKPAIASNRKDAKRYHDQIVQLEAQLAQLDRQISVLQAGIDGKPTGDGKNSTRPRYGVREGDWPTEEAQLQATHNQITAHISALRDEARRKRVPPSALP
jgi:hypothetical protein